MKPQVIFISALTLAPLVFISTPSLAQEPNQPGQNELIQRGEQEAARGNWQEAAQHFYKAVNEDDKNPVAFYDLGVAYLHLGDLSKAQIAEEQAINLKSDFISAYVQLATICSKAGDTSLAESTLRKALEADPNNQTVQANLKAILEGKEQRDASQASQTSQTSAATETAKPAENETKTEQPQPSPNEAPIKPSATVVSSVFQDGTAPLILDDILVHEAKCRNTVKPELAGRLEDAATALSNNQLDAAKEILQQVIQEDPSASCAYASLGAIMGMQGDYDAEIAKEKIALELDEHNAVAHCNLAWALAQKNRWQEALQENEKALELEGSFMAAGVGKAIAQSQLGLSDQAKETLKRLIESNPSEVLPRLAMGAILDAEGATSASQAELSEVLKLKPESLTIKRWLAAAELKKENWAGAQELYAQITKANPYDGQAWLGLGLALDRLGDQPNSLDALQKAVRMSPDSAAAHLALGLAFKARGDLSAAAKELKEAHRLNPKSALAEAHLKVQESGVK